MLALGQDDSPVAVRDIARKYTIPITVSTYGLLSAIGKPEMEGLINVFSTSLGEPMPTSAAFQRIVPSHPYNLMVDAEGVRNLCQVPPYFMKYIVEAAGDRPWKSTKVSNANNFQKGYDKLKARVDDSANQIFAAAYRTMYGDDITTQDYQRYYSTFVNHLKECFDPNGQVVLIPTEDELP